MQRVALLEPVLKRDRAMVLAGLFALTALAWAYVAHLAQGMSGAGMDMSLPQMQSWGFTDFILMFVMWTVMMVAMMVPSATPMVVMFSNVSRRRRERQQPYVPTGVFLLGYALVWTGFAALATVANWGLHVNSFLSSMMGESTSPILGGGLLVSAGLFQWTRLKYACLTKCRSPLGFIMSEWRDEYIGVLSMGMKHGVYCLICCWALMALLFVLGVMNLLWIAALAGLVLIEKVGPQGHWFSRMTGLGLIGWGALMLSGYLN